MHRVRNSRFIRTFLAVIPLLIIPLVISLGVTPNTRNISAFAAAPTVLHDQLNSFEGTVVSFENGTEFSSQAADDFVVPAGKTWTLSQVDVQGFPVVGSAQPAFFNVFLYKDLGTLPSGEVANYSNLAYTINPTNGEYSIAFPSTLFGPGTYWISVQADTTAAGNRWTWTARLTPAVNNGAAWRNPGDGFGSGCTDWARKTACLPETNSGPDQTFRLHGVEDAPAPAPVLHDQINSFEGTVVSFENGTVFSSQAADDFVVPTGKTWTLSQVDVAGFPVTTTVQPTSFNVFLYSDTSTLPGSLVASYSNLSYVLDARNGEYTIAVPPTLLGAGTSWVSVQANTTVEGNRWTWIARLAPALNNGAAWRNPGNGFSSGCTNWARKTTCLPETTSGPDQTFRLHGVEADAPTATPTAPPTATATPVRGVPPGFEPHYACRSTKDGALRDTGVLVNVGPRPTCLKNEVLIAILVNDAP